MNFINTRIIFILLFLLFIGKWG